MMFVMTTVVVPVIAVIIVMIVIMVIIWPGDDSSLDGKHTQNFSSALHEPVALRG